MISDIAEAEALRLCLRASFAQPNAHLHGATFFRYSYSQKKNQNVARYINDMDGGSWPSTIPSIGLVNLLGELHGGEPPLNDNMRAKQSIFVGTSSLGTIAGWLAGR